jgi:WD40 repeat protein
VWNLQSQKSIVTLAGHSGLLSSVAFSPDGKTLAFASGDNNTIKVWNLQSQSLATLAGHSDSVYSVAFSPDGLTLASASADKTIILWNFDFDDLVKRGCDWVRGYLESSPYVSDSDRHLCDGIPKNQ